MNKKPKYWNTAKKYLSSKDKVMSSLINKYKSPSEAVLTSRKDIFFSLCKSIIGQQISVAAATLICCPMILLHSEKNIFFLEVSTASEGDLYLLISDDITLSLLDKYFFAVFQYLGFLFMPSIRWYCLFMINFSSKNY